MSELDQNAKEEYYDINCIECGNVFKANELTFNIDELLRKHSDDIKKEKNPSMKKRTKNRIADVREKRARVASGLARTARSARLRFCLFRRFVFIQGVCLSR